MVVTITIFDDTYSDWNHDGTSDYQMMVIDEIVLSTITNCKTLIRDSALLKISVRFAVRFLSSGFYPVVSEICPVHEFEIRTFTVPWPKFRIEIHSEPIRNFPNHSGICTRTKRFHSDLIQRNFSIRFNSRSIQNQPELLIRMNPVNPN